MKNEIKIALVVVFVPTGEEVFTRFVNPKKLMQELEKIKTHENWKVVETYLSNNYGSRL